MANIRSQRSSRVPDEARGLVIQALGPTFLVFRDKVQEELKLSDEQKKKLEKRLQDTVPDAMQFFQKLGVGDKKPEEREKELHAYVEKPQENLTAFLEGALKEERFKWLRQVMLQQEGPFPRPAADHRLEGPPRPAAPGLSWRAHPGTHLKAAGNGRAPHAVRHHRHARSRLVHGP